MRLLFRFLFILLLATLFNITVFCLPRGLHLIKAIPLPGVSGRIDHMALDTKGQRLFIAAVGNNSMEIVDLKAGVRIQSVKGFHEPQGVLYLPEYNQIYIANGADGICAVLDGSAYNLITNISFTSDADNIRYDSLQKLVYVGYGNGALGIIDPEKIQIIGNILLDGHPESFQIEESGQNIYINIPQASQVAVADKITRKVKRRWSVNESFSNFPMALDERARRLYVNNRLIPHLNVIDTAAGKTIAELNSAGDCDDIYLDLPRNLIYQTCGEGFLEIYRQFNNKTYSELMRIPTSPGARTSIWSQEADRLYIAAPEYKGHEAAILVYEYQDQSIAGEFFKQRLPGL